jgi:hypothetical protein
LIGVANGVLVYLFFDLMHEATEQTGARDPVSWLVFLGSLGISFVGLVALESSQIFGARAGKPVVVAADDDCGGDGLTQSRRGTGDRRQLRQRGIYAEPPAGGRVRLA